MVRCPLEPQTWCLHRGAAEVLAQAARSCAVVLGQPRRAAAARAAHGPGDDAAQSLRAPLPSVPTAVNILQQPPLHQAEKIS